MEIKNLQTFLALSRILNFTKTAEELGYAQSNITSQIKQLENEFGVLLFNRLGHTITLTEKGKELVPYAAGIIALANEASIQMSTHTKRRITIAASESLCIYRLPQILNDFNQSYPDTEILIQMIDTNDFVPYLTENQIDAAYALESPINNPYIKHYINHPEKIGLYTIPQNPLAAQKRLSVTDFHNVPFSFTGKSCCYRNAFIKDLESAEIKPNIVLETSSLQVIKEMTLSGLGICVLPEMAVKKELSEGKLVPLDYSTKYAISSQLICHKNKWISPELNAFINCASKYTNGSS